MQPSDIQIGKTYRCDGGWFRRVTDMKESVDYAGQRYTEVKFEAGRDPKRLRKQPQWNSVKWFASVVISACT